jgi:hypothetical protein
VSVNYVDVAALTSSGGVSSAERARNAANRLSRWADSGRAPRFTAGRASGRWNVLANGAVLLTPTRADAKRLGLTRRSLAHRWAAHLASAWATTFLRATPDGLRIGVNSARSVRVGGVARGPIVASSDAADVAAARAVPGGLHITAGHPGRATITIRRDGAAVRCAVRVMKWAGSVEAVNVQVTGSAAPADLLRDLISGETPRHIRLEPGAWSVILRRPAIPAVWTRGDRLNLSARVRLSGPGVLPVETTLPIHVTRRHLPPARNMMLFYSNNPETIRDARTLFRHAIDGMPARLLYHHQNAGDRALNIAVDVTNDGDSDVPAQIVDGTGPPSMDCVLAGHRAAYKFIKRSQSATGVILNIPAHGRRRLFLRRLAPGDTMSGIMLVRPLKHGDLSVSVRSELPGSAGGGTARGEEAGTAFEDPDKTVDASYTVNGPWTYVPIGKEGISNAGGVRLDGNYGVLYTVRLKLNNPTDARKTVRVLFEPRAGEARAALLINGALTETDSTFPPAEVRVASISLAPKQSRMVTVVTMPAAGGSYPAALIVRG